jgi:radical SAM protein with 4Fe4S-binding SPASM domain
MRLAGLDELQAKLQQDRRPWAASLEVTRRCNLRCVHCLRGPSHPDDGLTKEEICRLMDQLADLGCMRLVFTGGEPFARPDFLTIVEYAWQRRMATVILTNGTLITPELAGALSDLHVHEFQVSLYGASPQVHEAVTRVPGSFLATLRGIRQLIDQGLRVRIMMPVLALNVQEVGAVRALCEELGADFQRSLLLFSGDDGSDDPLSFLATDEQVHWLAGEEAATGSSLNSADGTIEYALDRPLCTAGFQQLGVGPDGSVYPCGALRLPAGNIRNQALAEIWCTSAVLEQVRRARPLFPASCTTCQLQKNCFWCPGLSLALAGEMRTPNHQDCRRTRVFYGGVDCGSI